MGIMRWTFFDKLKAEFSNKDVSLTYGYITKSKRIEQKLEKSHCVDAFCIADNLQAIQLNSYYQQKQIRRHNRQIHKANKLKGGILKNNQLPKIVLKFRLFDKVKLPDKRVGFIYGRRATGYFDIRDIDGISMHKGISCKKLKLIECVKPLITQRKEKAEARIKL